MATKTNAQLEQEVKDLRGELHLREDAIEARDRDIEAAKAQMAETAGQRDEARKAFSDAAEQVEALEKKLEAGPNAELPEGALSAGEAQAFREFMAEAKKLLAQKDAELQKALAVAEERTAIVRQLEQEVLARGSDSPVGGELVPLTVAAPAMEKQIGSTDLVANPHRSLFFQVLPMWMYEEVRDFALDSGWGDYVKHRVAAMAASAVHEDNIGSRFEKLGKFDPGARVQVIVRILPASAKARAAASE
mgnify:CR=1 FL=1